MVEAVWKTNGSDAAKVVAALHSDQLLNDPLRNAALRRRATTVHRQNQSGTVR